VNLYRTTWYHNSEESDRCERLRYYRREYLRTRRRGEYLKLRGRNRRVKETELIMSFTIFNTYWAIRMIEPRTMRCRGHVACMGDEK
jgi:hypothetical protein